MVKERGRSSILIGSSSSHLRRWMIVLTFLCFLISLSRLMVSMHDNIITISYYPIQKLTSNQHNLLVPTIYDNITAMPNMISSGPFLVNNDIPGLYEFNNVCLTKQLSEKCHEAVNHCEGDIQGIIYFTPNDDTMMSNPLRCVTCSAPLMHGWNDTTGRDGEEVGHRCGFTSTHVMYASDVADWNQCRLQPDAQRLTNLWEQEQVPKYVESIRYYNEPILSLNFKADNIGHSLFDHLLMYLPLWQRFKDTTYPFKGIQSHSIQGCLSDTNNDWYCAILRSMNAFGDDTKELPPTSNTTLTCYKSLFVTELAIQRGLKHGVLTKELFDELRDILFHSFNLDRGRNYHYDKQDEEDKHTKLLFYAHKPSGLRVFEGMDELVNTLSKQSKYQGVDFQMIDDFGSYSIIEQAY